MLAMSIKCVILSHITVQFGDAGAIYIMNTSYVLSIRNCVNVLMCPIYWSDIVWNMIDNTWEKLRKIYLVIWPGKIGTEHYSQVGRSHFVHITPKYQQWISNPSGFSNSKPVSDETQKLHQIFEDNIVLVRQLLDDKILTIVETALSWDV